MMSNDEQGGSAQTIPAGWETNQQPAAVSPPPILCSATTFRIALALSKAQGEFPVIERTKTVKVNTRARGDRPASSYTYRYAPLEEILGKTRAALAGNGLALTQMPVVVDRAEMLRSVLLHESGEWLANDIPVFVGNGDNRSQEYGGGITYARRSGATLLLGIAAEEDDDAGGGEGGGQSDGKGGMHKPDFIREMEDHYGYNQQRQPPREPRSKAPEPTRVEAIEGSVDDDPSTFDAAAGQGVDAGTGEVTSPWGSDLSKGEVQMGTRRAKIAGLDDAGVLALCGVIGQHNVAESLAKLKAAADRASGIA